jgi:deazaflavin-dependent oxidoreductase (nitroreductase family)
MGEMAPLRRRPGRLARLFARTHAVLYRLGIGRLLVPRTLLLTTRGRRSGKPRLRPLVYEPEGDTFYVLSVGGTRADWYRNLLANPEVTVQVGRRRLAGIAMPVLNPHEKARILRLCVQRSAWGAERFYRIPRGASDEELLQLAPHRAVVAVRPRTP